MVLDADAGFQIDPANTPPVNLSDTSNDTAGAGVGHANSFMDDKYRIVGALAEMRVNSQIFLADIPFDFQIEGELACANGKRRMGKSNMFLGMSLMVLDATAGFKIDPANTPPVSLTDIAFTNVGIAGSAIYDARDNSTMPNKGLLVDFTAWRYDDAIGSDFNYWSGRLKVHSFHQLHEKFVLGLRIDVSSVGPSKPGPGYRYDASDSSRWFPSRCCDLSAST